MKKRYRAAGAIILASFISMISPCAGSIYADGGTLVSATASDAAEAGDVPSDDKYGPWEILREPTYKEDGLKQRKYLAPDGTLYIQFMTIPKLTDTPESKPENPQEEEESKATESNSKKPSEIKDGIKGDSGGSSGSRRLIKKRRAETPSESADKIFVQDKPDDNADSTALPAETQEPVPETKSPDRPHASYRNTEGRTLSAQYNGSVGTDNETAKAVSQSAETSAAEADFSERGSAGEQIKPENSKNNKSPSLDAKEVTEKDNSFNKYDGGTIVAAGAFACWYAVVLLPMIKAVSWINRKRREKLSK